MAQESLDYLLTDKVVERLSLDELCIFEAQQERERVAAGRARALMMLQHLRNQLADHLSAKRERERTDEQNREAEWLRLIEERKKKYKQNCTRINRLRGVCLLVSSMIVFSSIFVLVQHANFVSIWVAVILWGGYHLLFSLGVIVDSEKIPSATAMLYDAFGYLSYKYVEGEELRELNENGHVVTALYLAWSVGLSVVIYLAAILSGILLVLVLLAVAAASWKLYFEERLI